MYIVNIISYQLNDTLYMYNWMVLFSKKYVSEGHRITQAQKELRRSLAELPA